MDIEIISDDVGAETTANMQKETGLTSNGSRTWDLGSKKLFITESEEERAMAYVYNEKVLRGVRKIKSKKSRGYHSPRKQLAPKKSKFNRQARKIQYHQLPEQQNDMDINEESFNQPCCNCCCHRNQSAESGTGLKTNKTVDAYTQTE